MVRQERRRTMTGGLLPCLVIVAGLVPSGCMPLPIVDAKGVLKSATLDSWGSSRVLTDGDIGIHHGDINGVFMAPELITSEGTLGGANGYPFAAGRNVLSLGPDDTPHVLYYSNSATSWPYLYGDLIHAWKESGVWETETVTTVEVCYGLGSHPAIAVDSVGDVHVSYASMECTSGDIEVRYARKDNGDWTDELIDTLSGLNLSYPVLVSRIALDPDEKPVIVTGAGGWDIEAHGSDAVIRMAQAADGGGWEIEEIFTWTDPCIGSHCLSGSIDDLSLAVGSTGGKAVGFEFEWHEWTSQYIDYSVIVDDGGGWTTDAVCTSYGGEIGSAGNCRAGDIAYDPVGQLHAMFTRERFDGPPPDSPVRQSILLAHRAGTEWVEETLWDNTLYNVEVNDSHLPHLLCPSAFEAKVVYQGPLLMYLAD